jgi:hypothetical protein
MIDQREVKQNGEEDNVWYFAVGAVGGQTYELESDWTLTYSHTMEYE